MNSRLTHVFAQQRVADLIADAERHARDRHHRAARPRVLFGTLRRAIAAASRRGRAIAPSHAQDV